MSVWDVPCRLQRSLPDRQEAKAQRWSGALCLPYCRSA